MVKPNIYYDISLNNSGLIPQQANLYDNRTIPLLKNPNDYALSVVRFTIPTAYVPIFIWKSQLDLNGNPTNTADNSYYSITLNNTRVFLQYTCYNLPDIKTNPQRLFIYSYQQFIDAINAALNVAWLAVGGAATAPPYMIYNAQTGLISIIAQYAYANSANYQLYFNAPLFGFFENFEVERLGFVQTLGKDNRILIKNNGNNDYSGHPPGYGQAVGPDSYEMKQEYDSLFLWNSARSIVMMSTSIPVESEAINIKNSQNLSSGNTYRKILTDFELNIQSGISNNTVRSYIQYTPSAEYRMLSLNSDSALSIFDIQIYFQTSDLTLYPLFINPGESISIKILFRDKNY